MRCGIGLLATPNKFKVAMGFWIEVNGGLRGYRWWNLSDGCLQNKDLYENGIILLNIILVACLLLVLNIFRRSCNSGVFVAVAGSFHKDDSSRSRRGCLEGGIKNCKMKGKAKWKLMIMPLK